MPFDAHALAELLADWRDNPVAFVREAIGAEPEKWQAEALEYLDKEGRLAVRSGHGVGKTTLEAWAIFWFGLTRLDAKIGITAPAAPQIEVNLWPDLHKWRRSMAKKGALGAYLAEQIRITQGMVEFANGNIATARTARPEQPEALQGLHATNVLILIDEASGVLEPVFEASQGALSTPGAKIGLFGNPTRTQGYFYDCFHRGRSFWRCMKVSSEDVSGERVDRKFIEEIRAKYGVDSNVYRIRVMGEFPTSEEDAVIPVHLCEAAIQRKVDLSGSKIIWGLDVARFGNDDSALAKRCGNSLLEKVKSWHGLDTMQVAGTVMKEYMEAEHKPETICVDVIGIGAGVVDRLMELGLPAIGINVAELPAYEPERYMRLRDQLWFNGREWLERRNCAMPDDPDLIGELTSVKYRLTSSGKLQVESKDEMRKRGVQSPNKADALLLTFGASDLPARSTFVAPPTHYDS